MGGGRAPLFFSPLLPFSQEREKEKESLRRKQEKEREKERREKTREELLAEQEGSWLQSKNIEKGSLGEI